MNGKFRQVSLLAAFCVGCARVTAVQPAMGEGTARGRGDLTFRGAVASFDQHRVWSSQMEISEGPPGIWRGRVGNTAVNLEMRPDGHFVGPETHMVVTPGPNGTRMSGLFGGRFVEMETHRLDPAKTPSATVTPETEVVLAYNGETWTSLYVGTPNLRGSANQLHPPMPQFLLAAMVVTPTSVGRDFLPGRPSVPNLPESAFDRRYRDEQERFWLRNRERVVPRPPAQREPPRPPSLRPPPPPNRPSRG